MENYTDISEKFDAYNKKDKRFDVILEQILVYFVFTYFCGSVYDSNIYGKAKLCVYSVYYIKELLKAMFVRNDYELTQEEIEDIVIRYSRELEHSDINLGKIEEF